MKSRFRAAAILAGFLISGYYSVRTARYWTTQELSPLHRYLDSLERTLPPDARILLAAPEAHRRTSPVQHAGARLHPRAVYLLPPGVDSVEGARGWIREKRLTWVVFLGGREFDPEKAYARRLDDGR
jgi:hypothetical protein